MPTLLSQATDALRLAMDAKKPIEELRPLVAKIRELDPSFAKDSEFIERFRERMAAQLLPRWNLSCPRHKQG